MTSPKSYLGRPHRLFFLLVVIALAAMAAAGSAAAKSPVRRSSSAARCGDGYRAAAKVIHKNGKSRRVVFCKRSASAPEASAGPQSPAPTTPPATAPILTPPVETPPIATPPVETPPISTPPAETPPSTPPVVTTGDPEVHTAIGQGFSQNPLVPNEVTWHYAASATRTVTTNGVEKTESVPLPEGRLAFFLDGQLDCEIQAGGAIAGSACTRVLQRLGAHEVEVIFSGATSSTVTRTDYIGKYPTSTSLQVSIEPTAPEYLDIGPNKYGYDQHAFEVGRLRITGGTTPSGYPTFSCEGQASGCVNPEVSLSSHHGSLSVPLYAQHRLNMANGLEEWQVAFDAYSPSAREEGYFWQFPAESVGKQFFHAVSEPNPEPYEPSSVTVPLNLNGGHYPFYRWMKKGEAGGSVAAVEGTARKAFTIGTYEKFDGPEEWLKVSGTFYAVAGEAEGCVYRLRIDGQDLNESRRSSNQGWEFLNGWPGISAGPHTFEVWVERAAGAGAGNCATESGYFEAYEVHH